ncbi:MAG: HlyC/CorC family transporter [Victivallales bacterium]|nr:HlyC/CorC family transporter [Victivallales bacterium]
MKIVWFTLVVLLLLYLLAALFCCMETAFTSVNRTWLRNKADQGNLRAATALRLLEQSASFFGTVLLGTNLVHVSITTLVGAVLASAFLESRMAARFGLDLDSKSLVTSLIVTPTLLLFTEIVPKAVGRTHADALALLFAGSLDFFRMLFALPVSAIAWVSGRLARLFGVSTELRLGLVSRDDLKALAIVAEEHGVLQKESGRMMSSVLELDNRSVESIMVPLVDVKSLPITATIGDVEELVRTTGFTHFPVYESRIDEIVGIIGIRRCMFENGLYADDVSHEWIARQPIRPLVERTIGFVPETKTVGDLLNDFRTGRMPMAAVVDEYGGVVGIVTAEDLIGLLIGGVADLRNQSRLTIRRVSEGVYECEGKTGIHELAETLGISIDNDGYETAAGLALKLLGRIPVKGSSVTFSGYEIRIMEVVHRRISRLRFTRLRGVISQK